MPDVAHALGLQRMRHPEHGHDAGRPGGRSRPLPARPLRLQAAPHHPVQQQGRRQMDAHVQQAIAPRIEPAQRVVDRERKHDHGPGALRQDLARRPAATGSRGSRRCTGGRRRRTAFCKQSWYAATPAASTSNGINLSALLDRDVPSGDDMQVRQLGAIARQGQSAIAEGVGEDRRAGVEQDLLPGERGRDRNRSPGRAGPQHARWLCESTSARSSCTSSRPAAGEREAAQRAGEQGAREARGRARHPPAAARRPAGCASAPPGTSTAWKPRRSSSKAARCWSASGTV